MVKTRDDPRWQKLFDLIEKKYLPAGHPPPGAGNSNKIRGALRMAADEIGISRTAQNGLYLAACRALGREPDWSLYVPKKEKPFSPSGPSPEVIRKMRGPLGEEIAALLRRGSATLEDIAHQCECSKGQALDAIETLQTEELRILEQDGRYHLDRAPEPAFTSRDRLEYRSRADNTYLFGVISDTHYGSKYARLDVASDLFDRFAAAGVDRVFHGGNWIDGEATFNRHDLLVHGMDAQCRYLAQHWPAREGITTYAVSGDDHEGWYSQREGVDIGAYAESRFRDAGRRDWVDLGYMEAHIDLVNSKSGKRQPLAVVHAGGGSAYALSYSVQKIVESLEGGEKPAVALYGHFHKLWAGNIRNVWVLQPGCTQDQTPFMRKRRLEAHVGGAIVQLEQDPKTGAIVGFTPKMIRYFNRQYYDGRWSHSGDVTQAERSL